ncbi:ABC transporter permease [Microbacterium saperdae]|uniref:Peptide/nickel transport system permease protein n=1 Tax=Microbacterium saperdae TaxID=69368 RepID=A0A543BL82_9MICO|nr:ABC transporter permease [Microbacterium saperdae]TQL85600.1 peptide/nickel transport system permease protein [Microbacterium saperdae]GGM62365.1 peptide ABC transporter permease [Microbacterium saperdae]
MHSPGFSGFVVRRILASAATLLVVALIVFLLIRSIPGDPTITILGLDSSQDERDRLRDRLGLNAPLWSQFTHWLLQILQGDLGYSYREGSDIASIVLPAFRATLSLTLAATVLAVAIALVFGLLGTHEVRIVRRVSDAVEAFLLSAPQYSVALLLLIVFTVLVPVFPSGGIWNSSDPSPASVASHLFLPALALALATGAQLGRSLKTSVDAIHSTELVPSLRMRGLSPARVAGHVFHNALPPVVTLLGFQMGWMLGGAIFVETIFSIPGLGSLVVQAVGARDYDLVQVTAFVIAAAFILLLLIVDVVVALIDPRIRVGRL